MAPADVRSRAIARTKTLDEEIDALFALAPEEFTGARDALAKERRSAGDKEGAAEIKALRKPTAAAWAVNQAARKHRKALEELLDLGEQLRKAQSAAMSGRGATKLRDLSAQRRKDVDALAKKAVKLLGGSGEAQREAITNTLEAAVASAAAADAVRAGRLSKDLPAPSGFGDDAAETDDDADAAAPANETRAARDRRRAARAARRGAPTDESEAAETEAEATAGSAVESKTGSKAEQNQRRRELERAVKQKRDALREAAEEAQAAAREGAAARAEVSRLQDALVTANGRAKAAAERARVAQWTQSQAQQDLDAAERALERG